mmetsp:Transcript_19045/g.29782  ORF Transcript_19045/g.29782 Transcript_19045/m.29782 type:complete len:324 (-) Transcript_19045:269-1240(-)
MILLLVMVRMLSIRITAMHIRIIMLLLSSLYILLLCRVQIMSMLGIMILCMRIRIRGNMLIVRTLINHILLRLGLLVRRIHLHFFIESLLIFLRQILILLLFLIGQGTPTFSKNGAHFYEFDSREFSHDVGTFIECEEDEGSTCTFGLLGVLYFLHVLFVEATVFDEISSGIVSGRRDITSHLSLIPRLILSRMRLPPLFLLRTQTLVHMRSKLGKLSKRHSRINILERFTHTVLIQQISRHVTFGSIRITWCLDRATAHTRFGWEGMGHMRRNSITLDIIPRWRDISRQFMQIPCLISLGTLIPRLLFRRGHFGVHGRGVFG